MHYKNGREAKVGDLVVGYTYNRKGIVAGALLSLTPGPDSCSAMVGYLQIWTSIGSIGRSDHVVKIQGTEHHGGGGQQAVTVYREDFTECKLLLHADDVVEDGHLLVEEGKDLPLKEGVAVDGKAQ